MTGLNMLIDEAQRDFAGLGALGQELVAVLDVVTATAGDRGVGVLADPGFALETLTAAGPRVETAAIGRVLDYLRDRAGAADSGSTARLTVTVAEAVAAYEGGPLSLLAAGTGHTYRTWTRRLVTHAGDADVATVTTGDLTDVIARFAGGGSDRRGRSRASEGNAVAAYRNLWTYLVEKGYARTNVAARLRKPARGEPRRRPFRPEEAALVRQLARLGHDPLLDEVTVTLAERLGLRRIEICRLRLCDVDLGRAEAKVWGKGDKDRLMPLPPGLVELLGLFIEDRRPASCPSADWAQRDDALLRRRPTPTWPEGRPTGRRRIEELFARLGRAAPELFAGGDLSLHSYRHALATFVDGRWGRPVTRAVLGHTSRRSPTDAYVHVEPATVTEALRQYEAHMLASRSHPV